MHGLIRLSLLTIIGLAIGLGFAAATDDNPKSATPNPQSAIRNPQSKNPQSEALFASPTWERLFGLHARPHVITFTNSRDLEWLLEPGRLDDIERMRFGQAIYWESLYTNRQYPVDGHYTYAEPDLVAQTKRELRARGIKPIGYLAGWHWKTEGLTPLAAIQELALLDVDGVCLDNGEVGATPAETLWFFAALHAAGYEIDHHTSVTPHYRYVRFSPLWDQLYVLHRWVNETGPNYPGPINGWEPTSVLDPLWLYWVSGVYQGGWIGSIKAGAYNQLSGGELVVLHDSHWRGREREYVWRLPPWGCTFRASPGTDMVTFASLYYPTWRHLRNLYLSDRPAWRRIIAHVWGVDVTGFPPVSGRATR